MKYHASVLLFLCLVVNIAASATPGGAAYATAFATAKGSPGTERNRIAIEKRPVLAFSVKMAVDILEKKLGRELWRINFRPAIAAEISFAGGLLAGITLPFTLQAGFPFYNTGSIEGNIGPPRMGIDYAGSSGAVSYRFGASFTLAGGAGTSAESAVAVPVAGGSASIACIRDPVALSFGVDTEVAPAPVTGRWGFRGVGGTAAVLAVLNEVISIELGVIVYVRLNTITGAPPPSVIGRTGLYARMAPFAASLFVSRDLWNPIYPATISTGIGISWEAQ